MEEIKKESFFAEKKTQIIIRALTAFSFVLYTVYQIFLFFVMDDKAKLGRGMGILCFLLLTFTSLLAISPKSERLIVRYVLLTAGLLSLFAIKLLNIPGLFKIVSFSNPSSVLNCTVFVLSEAGALILAFYYMTFKNRIDTPKKQKLSYFILSFVIVLYAACFVMECIMIIKYRINIDLGRKLTLLSRVLYCAAFVGTAVGYMLPPLKLEAEARPGEFVYSEDVEDEIDLIM